jgi:Uma2 family endonuclease
MSVMTAPAFWSDQSRALTVEDMADMPDDEFRYELDDGVLIVSPAPSPLHQRVVFRLAQVLDAVCPPELEVLPGPGINITRFQHRVPDLAVVVRADPPEPTFQVRPPVLGVEVASPRTRLYDRNRKKDVYEQFGIVSFWIVSPDWDKPELTVFELQGGRYRQVAHVAGDEAFEAALPFPVAVTPSRLVRTGRPA